MKLSSGIPMYQHWYLWISIGKCLSSGIENSQEVFGKESRKGIKINPTENSIFQRCEVIIFDVKFQDFKISEINILKIKSVYRKQVSMNE